VDAFTLMIVPDPSDDDGSGYALGAHSESTAPHHSTR
jgi:hypothetical protein